MEGIVERYCKECIFYSIHSTCHRYPPIYQYQTKLSIFPYVSENDWCGEFKDKWQIRTERVDP